MQRNRHIEPCTQNEMDRLFDKQFTARMQLQKNPYARAMNFKLRRYFRDKLKDCLGCLKSPGNRTDCNYDECRDLDGCLFDDCPHCDGRA